jgi:hypothetical protein
MSYLWGLHYSLDQTFSPSNRKKVRFFKTLKFVGKKKMKKKRYLLGVSVRIDFPN